MNWIDNAGFDSDQKTALKALRRDLFAALAMHAKLSCSPHGGLKYSVVAGESVFFADALIAELDKEPESK